MKIRGGRTLHLSSRQSFDETETSYADAWLRICDSYRRRFEEWEELRPALTRLAKRSNPALGASGDRIQQTQDYLDALNHALEHDFPIVRRQKYGDPWKIGIVIVEWTSDRSRYIYLPIERGVNQPLIRFVDKNVLHEVRGLDEASVVSTGPKPFRNDPERFAFSTVREEALALIKRIAFDLPEVDVLAAEFLFAFLDQFHIQLNLQSDIERISVDNLAHRITRILPLWVNAALTEILDVDRIEDAEPGNLVKLASGDNLLRREYFDPSSLICSMSRDRARLLARKAATAARRSTTPIPAFAIGNRRLPPRIASAFLASLERRQIPYLERPYPRRDWSRLRQEGNLAWNSLTKEAATARLHAVAEHLPSCYEATVQANFPNIAKKLDPWGGRGIIAIQPVRFRDRYQASDKAPGLRYRLLQPLGGPEPRQLVVTHDELPPLDIEERISLDGKIYEASLGGSCIADVLFDDTPILDCVVNTLLDRLENLDKATRSVGWDFTPRL